jgi:hypothetical protein
MGGFFCLSANPKGDPMEVKITAVVMAITFWLLPGQPNAYLWPENHLVLKASRIESKAISKEVRSWDVSRSKNYAKTRLESLGRGKEWKCLDKLWTKESNWRSRAFNKQPVYLNGEYRHAGGIPQMLGLNPNKHPKKQIEKGLEYLGARYYGSPCKALEFHLLNNWY